MKIHICPNCGSTDLKSNFLASPTEKSRPSAGLYRKLKHQIAAVFIGWQPQNPSTFICLNCDYYGICPEIEASKAKQFKKRLKKNSFNK